MKKKLALFLVLMLVPVFAGAQLSSTRGHSYVAFDGEGCSVGQFKIWTDLSELKIKQCVNGVASDLGAGGGGGTSVALDLGDDGSDESAALTEIATTGSCGTAFTTPSADKFLIDCDELPSAGADYAPALSTKTSNYTLTVNDDVILCDTSGGAVTITTPAAATVQNHIFYIRKIGSSATNACTVDGNASETINSHTSIDLTNPRNTIAIISDGSNWITPIARQKNWFMTTTIGNLSTGATQYFGPVGATTPNATESAVRMFLPPGTLSDFWCRLVSAPDNGGGTQSYTLNLRVAAADTALECVLSEATLVCPVDTDTHHMAQTSVDIESTPAGTPSAQQAYCYFSFIAD